MWLTSLLPDRPWGSQRHRSNQGSPHPRFASRMTISHR